MEGNPSINVQVFQLTNFTPDDLVSFMQLVDNDFDPPIRNRKSLTDYATKLLQFSVLFVALDASGIVGAASLYCNDLVRRVSYLGYLAVRREARGTGVGNSLVRACMNHAKEVGMRVIETETSERATGVIRFYQAMGFRITGKDPRRPDGCNSVLFEYTLDA